MSYPAEADFAIVKVGDGAGPEVFTIACGIENVQVNRTANTSSRFTRDCAKPGEVPVRRTKTTGKQLDITADGLTNVPDIDAFEDLLGVKNNYKIELYADDDTDTGELLGTFAGNFIMTTANLNLPRNDNSASEVAFENNGPWTWTAAP